MIFTLCKDHRHYYSGNSIQIVNSSITNMSDPGNLVKLGTAHINTHAYSTNLSTPGWDQTQNALVVYVH